MAHTYWKNENFLFYPQMENEIFIVCGAGRGERGLFGLIQWSLSVLSLIL